MSQYSLLDPLLFNIHMCDLFYIMRKWPIANYAYDTSSYTGGGHIRKYKAGLWTSRKSEKVTFCYKIINFSF